MENERKETTVLSPLGMREKDYYCLWRQLNQDITLPATLVVDERLTAYFTDGKKIVEQFSSGCYQLNEKSAPEIMKRVGCTDSREKLRLFFVKQISRVNIDFQAYDSKQLSIIISVRCKVTDQTKFWSHFLCNSNSHLMQTDIEIKLAGEIQGSARSCPVTLGEHEKTDPECAEFLSGINIFTEYALQIEAYSVKRVEHSKYPNTIDWFEAADASARMFTEELDSSKAFMSAYITESHAVRFEYIGPEETTLLGYAIPENDRYYLLKNRTTYHQLGIHVISMSDSEIRLSISPLMPYSKSPFPVRSAEVSIPVNTVEKVYEPMVFDASIEYSIGYWNSEKAMMEHLEYIKEKEHSFDRKTTRLITPPEPRKKPNNTRDGSKMNRIATKCVSCCSWFDASSKACPFCGKIVETSENTSMLKCEVCNKWFDDGIAFGVCPHCGHVHNYSFSREEEASRDPRWLPCGTVLSGRYEILEGIRYDGLRIVYKVWDRSDKVTRTIKEFFLAGVANRIIGTTEVLLPSSKRKDEFEYGKKRLIEEAKKVAKFQSSSIARVYDCFEENNTSYMVMEELPEESLKDFFDKKREFLRPEFVVKIGKEICDALSEIHTAGMINRSLAPDSIFITEDGVAKIIDFSAARLSKDDANEELVILRPGYAPPEQYEKYDLAKDKQSARTDIYALGATLYYCLTGTTPPESVERKLNDSEAPLVEPQECNSVIPDYLIKAINWATASDPRARYPDADSLKRALSGEDAHYQMVRFYYHSLFGFGKRHELSAYLSDNELEEWKHMSFRKKKKLVEQRRNHNL